MSSSLRRCAAAATLVAALIATLAGAAAAGPAPTTTAQARVDAYLAANPGGKQINATEIAYPGGFVVAVVAPLSAAADCPSGWFCFYDGVNYGYPRGRLSSCGFQDLARWNWTNRTESVHYNLSTGSTAFLNHTSGGDTPLFTIGASRRTDNDVAPYRNTADRVYRYCS